MRTLLGYTDVGADPRNHHSDDPALRTYEDVLPGMVPVAWNLHHLQGWLAYL
ncbi:MAG: hypothetical protein OEQ39_10530 [Gammaproteobacteria bacterium]|nr:hypothetical protein [Gammaproteobacteria bacterium]MDH3467726.1 hypothetical protein [Gammaproteobacteria bacterium]